MPSYASLLMNYFESLPEQTRKYHLQLAEEVQRVVPIEGKTFRILTSQLNPDIKPSKLLGQVSTRMVKSHPYLYYFRVLNNPDLAVIERTFKKTKDEKKNNRAYPRFNGQSKLIYVGCSWGMFSRFKDHLGYGAKGTYALQFAHWAQELNLELEFVYAEYPQATPSKVLQALEDMLWDNLKPMLGRRGQR